jgi:flagellar basal body rod protein FlgG
VKVFPKAATRETFQRCVFDDATRSSTAASGSKNLAWGRSGIGLALVVLLHADVFQGRDLMLRGLYSIASAMDAAAANHEVVADNLAHASTPGFRRHAIHLETLLPAGDNAGGSPIAPIPSVRPNGSFTDFNPGPVQQTGNPLDVAVTGSGYFVVDGPRGPLYTRNGVFEISDRGDLQTKDGMRVRGQGGAINIPATASSITISQDGAIRADGVEVGRFQLATFDDPRVLRRASGTCFDGPAPQTPAPGVVKVEQGYREGSNVQVVQEMVAMLIGARQYEAAEKTLRAMTEAVQQNTRPQG